MPRKRQRPQLTGAELAFFDVLVALHVRYIKQTESCCGICIEQGMSREQILEIARLSFEYVLPPEIAVLVNRTMLAVDQQQYGFARKKEKPS